MRRPAPQRYGFAPELQLGVSGPPQAKRHFLREYGRVAVASGTCDVEVEVSFSQALRRADGGAVGAGGHKTARWRVVLTEPHATPMRASISLRGRPRWFGLSLVQGYFVEPLLSIAAARSGFVLVPAAGLAEDGRAVLLMGRSGSGKSSLSARALSAGRPVFGDDQVLLDDSGRVWAFPRRLRFYPDLFRTAPAAYARLAPRLRSALVARRVIGALTRGYVAPSLAVDRSELGASALPAPLPVGRVVIIERPSDADEVRSVGADSDLATGEAVALLDAQRAKLCAAADANWEQALREVRDREKATLSRALAGTRVERLSAPRHWDAARAVTGLAERLGVEW